jgi:NADH:ubiquinone reductase (non-electrogenic)
MRDIHDDRWLTIAGTGWGSVSLLKKLDTENYNVIVVSPRNYFLFTPLLPSCTVGTIEHRSIMEPIRNFLRHKKAAVKYYEAEATKIDYENKVVYIDDESEIKGASSKTTVPFDMLVVGVGAENATFGASLHGSGELGMANKDQAFPVSARTASS